MRKKCQRGKDQMKIELINRLIKNQVFIITMRILALVLALFLILICIIKPDHGRLFTIPLVDTLVIQADPPEEKLLGYMEKKYNKKFVKIDIEIDDMKSHHSQGSALWGFYYNGIIVTTADSNSEYYHVRDDYGTFLDNYGCYLVNDAAEKETSQKLSKFFDEYAVSIFPKDIQKEELPAEMTVDEYLDKADYNVCIVICGKGDEARNDYEKICESLNKKTEQGWLTMMYVDKSVFDQIDINSLQSIEDTGDFNLKLKYIWIAKNTFEPVFVTPDIEKA